ncbi:MAG: type II methionyl aminopeptidase [archaeon]|nr:type II methionyl aminopeptidase [archaeon]
MNPSQIQNSIQAGKIAKETVEYARTIVKKDVLLLEIAEKIEKKIVELGGKPAFPTNLSINDIAAHYTPAHDDTNKANGLLKVDLGVHIEGFIADTAFSVDLENSEENKKLIKASEDALSNVLKSINKNITLSQIGKTIQETIEKEKYSPITNLSGHSMNEYDLHSGITIPNLDNKNDSKLPEGLYAIEPFATAGNGKVYDGKLSGIYFLVKRKPIRSQTAREVLDFIEDEYATMPFCSRWLVNKFGTKSLLSLKQLEQEGIIHQFEQLIETSHKPVSQSEHTVLITKDKIIVTTN